MISTHNLYTKISQLREREGARMDKGIEKIKKDEDEPIRPTIIADQYNNYKQLQKQREELKESIGSVQKQIKELDSQAKAIHKLLCQEIGDVKVLIKVNNRLLLLAVENCGYDGKKLRIEKFITDEALEQELMLKKLKKAK